MYNNAMLMDTESIRLTILESVYHKEANLKNVSKIWDPLIM